MADRVSPPNPENPRIHWTTHEGFILYTDTQNELMQRAATRNVEALSTEDLRYGAFHASHVSTADIAARNKGGVSLFATLFKFRWLMPQLAHESNGWETFFNNYGITDQDKRESRPFTQNHGFANIEFPLVFSGGIANDLTEQWIREGHMTRSQKEASRLRDWAEMISSPWFGDIVFDMAITGIGVYGPYPGSIEDYGREDTCEGLSYRMRERKVLPPDFRGSLFTTSVTMHPETQKPELRATLTNEFRLALRRMRAANSAGCPVARLVVNMPQQDALQNPHVQRLLQEGIFTEEPGRSPGDIRLRQDTSAIHRTLVHVANHLRAYDAEHGTPRLYGAAGGAIDTIVHEK